MRTTFQIELRGQKVTIEGAVLPPERDVGLCGYGLEDETIIADDGTVLDWELDDDEWFLISAALAKVQP